MNTVPNASNEPRETKPIDGIGWKLARQILKPEVYQYLHYRFKMLGEIDSDEWRREANDYLKAKPKK